MFQPRVNPLSRFLPAPVALSLSAALFPAAPLRAQAKPPTWEAELLKARRDKDAEFRDGKASPMRGIQRLVVEADRELGLRATATGLERVEGPAPVVVKRQNGKWLWCTEGRERPLIGTFELGRFHVQALPGPDRATLLVFDPERAEAKAFQGLRYFAPDPAFAVTATLEPLTEAQPITLSTTRSLTKAFTPFARLHFQLGGKTRKLTAYKAPDEDTLFIPFTDATTGEETYSVGRFLEVPAPKGRSFTLDFNAAFNPLCNYSSIWNCPIPPEENALPVPVRAGEKTYPMH